MLISVDVGFSGTKFCYESSGERVCGLIPTAVAQPSLSGIREIGTEQPIIQFTDGTALAVGDDAFDSAHQVENQSLAWLIEVMPALVIGVIVKAGFLPGQIDRLAVGLPIQFWKDSAAEVKARLANISLATGNYTYDVLVYSQGAGAFYYYLQSMSPPANASGLLIDVGGNTVQVLGFRKLKIKASFCKQYNHLGMLVPAKILAQKICADHTTSMSTIKAMKVLSSGTFSMDNDYKALSQQLIEDHMRFLANTLEADFGDQMAELQHVVLAGGGAYHLAKHLPSAWRQKTLIFRDAEYANAIGYYLQSK